MNCEQNTNKVEDELIKYEQIVNTPPLLFVTVVMIRYVFCETDCFLFSQTSSTFHIHCVFLAIISPTKNCGRLKA